MSSVPENPRALGLPYDEWRPEQRETVETILEMKNYKQAVLLEALPGAGKSAIAAAISMMSGGKVLILTKTIQLLEQYLRDFPFMATLLGKANFPCILPNANVSVDQAQCSTGWRCPERAACPFFVQSREARSSHVLATTYAKALSTWMGEYEWIICDEGHLIERQLQSFYTIRLPYKEFKEMEMPVPPFGSLHEASRWADGKLAQLDRRCDLLGRALRANPELTHVRKRFHMLQRLTTPLRSLSNIDLDALWSMEPYRNAFYIRPLWAYNVGHRLFNRGAHILIQSATILDGGRLARLLGLKGYKHIIMPVEFPVERRPIYYWPVTKIDMNSTPEAITKLIHGIDTVIDRYPARRGIVHTVNMKLTEEVGSRSRHSARMIVQKDGRKRGESIDRFLRTPYSVLVSPSVMTGLDGRFEKARFQIIAKMPFENQGETAIAERLDQDSDWYAYQTAFNLQQAAGRVMRDKRDHGDTWILDEHMGWFMRQNEQLFSDWFKEALQKRELQ